MPNPSSTTAHQVATGLLHGAFTSRALVRELTRLRGRKSVLLPRIAKQLVVAFGERARPRIDDVAACLHDSTTFAKAFERGVAAEALAKPRRPRMQPAPGAAATWPVPKLLDQIALARWLQIEPSELHALCAPRRRERLPLQPRRLHYHHTWIPRRSGLPRLIEAPKLRLKEVQQRILTGILDVIPAHAAAHGFVRGRSPLTFVAPHQGQRCVLRMDVVDFFASFRRGRVLRIFLAVGYPEPVANALADLCTTSTPRAICTEGLGPPLDVPKAEALREKLLRRHLPQGAPTSPALANLCAYALDARLAGLARKFAATYTRYADDLLFSGGQAFAHDALRCEVHVGAVLLQCGLAAAHQKTKCMRRSASQRAAGLVMNVHPAIPRRDRERLEAILVNCLHRGVAGQNRDGHPDFRAHLRGRIAHVAQVHPTLGARLLALHAEIAW